MLTRASFASSYLSKFRLRIGRLQLGNAFMNEGIEGEGERGGGAAAAVAEAEGLELLSIVLIGGSQPKSIMQEGD